MRMRNRLCDGMQSAETTAEDQLDTSTTMMMIMMMMKNNSFLALLVLTIAASALVSGFVQQPAQSIRSAPESTTTAVNGIWDKVVKSMESGYAGGEESPYAKIKAADAKKEEIRRKKALERQKRGFTELKDVKKKSFVKLKYPGAEEEEEPPAPEKKKLFGLF
ncbi:unnamed protein product [Pseudo-nitzschia multistriata]|uniref:Uncharacterized protein n=1 Tax=Pseudo-nitzschia multistriata TaxID=183589 RepID=A0A448Z9F0_9STRA|nr:unnamed protein product [Pseudo-nitzschia multistriata]